MARLGSVKHAAAELAVSEAAVSLHVGQLRKELGDQLFTRTASGLAFTPGGLRLASRAAEMLNLQERTVIEVRQAGHGRRMLRIATASMFAEHAAPGLIDLFVARAADLDVELSVHDPRDFVGLLHTRSVDVAIGPAPGNLDESLASQPILNYRVILVCGPGHPLAGRSATAHQLREQIWLLGPSAAADTGVIPTVLHRVKVPEDRQRIFQSHAAALEEVKRNQGVAPVISFAVARDLANNRLARIGGPSTQVDGVWHTVTLAERGAATAAAELIRFISTPRATQAMLRGPGVNVGHFRPAVHVTLWS